MLAKRTLMERIKLCHEGFQEILGQAVPTQYESSLFPNPHDWRSTLDRCEVRVQWDPDRDLSLRPLDRRAIQVGLRGQVVRRYVHDWIMGLEDATPLAHAIRDAVRQGTSFPAVPEERVYPLSEDV